MPFDYSMLSEYELNVELDLDINDVYKTVRKFNILTDRIEDEIMYGLDVASIKITQKLESLLDKYDVPALKKDILIEDFGTGFSISVVGDGAIFVEYGTGIVGKNSPHPVPWEYDINEHGDKGWVYQDEDGWHWTKGMASKPYFWELQKWIRSYGIIKRCINARLKKIK